MDARKFNNPLALTVLYLCCALLTSAVTENAEDVVIPTTSNPSGETNDTQCILGSLRMDLGDEVNQSPKYSGHYCLRCVCEVPPVPTCQHLFYWPRNATVSNMYFRCLNNSTNTRGNTGNE